MAIFGRNRPGPGSSGFGAYEPDPAPIPGNSVLVQGQMLNAEPSVAFFVGYASDGTAVVEEQGSLMSSAPVRRLGFGERIVRRTGNDPYGIRYIN